MYENHQNNCIQYKTTKTTFPKKSKAVFISIRYRKTSQTQDVKSQSTERSVRKIAQPKREFAFEQKTRIVSCREISASSQKSFFYLQPKNQAEQSSKSHFWNVLNVVLESFCFAQESKVVFISIRYPQTSQTQDVKSQSTKRSLRELVKPKLDSASEQKDVLFQVERSHEGLKTIFVLTAKESSRAELKKTILEPTQRRFGKFLFCLGNENCFYIFINIRYHKTSQTQDVKSQSTKRSLRSLAQPKRDSAFEQKDVFFQVERSEEVLKTAFLVTTEATSPRGFKKTVLERTQRRFGKFLFCSRNKSYFYKYSISQDISIAGCKETKYLTYPSRTGEAET